MRLKQRIIAIRQAFQAFLVNPKYQFYCEAFEHFSLGVYDLEEIRFAVRIIILCQIFPFEQFLDADGKELRKIKPRKFGKSGKPIRKRIGLSRFHACLGKAVKPWESGKKKAHIVTGSVLARIQLYLWAKPMMAMSPPKNPQPQVKALYDRYLNDIQAKLTDGRKIDPNHPDNNSLKQWGKAGVGDKLVKLLFKELIGAYCRHKEQ